MHLAVKTVVAVNGKAIPLLAWTGFLEVQVLRFHDNQHMKVVRISALSPGHLYPQDIFLVIIYVRRRVNPRATVRPERLCQGKIPVTASGIVPATFRLVAHCLN